jgi:hypothetical protein
MQDFGTTIDIDSFKRRIGRFIPLVGRKVGADEIEPLFPFGLNFPTRRF